MMIFARLGSAVALLPGFGEAYVAVRVRLAFALLFSLALMPMLADRVPVLPAGLDHFGHEPGRRDRDRPVLRHAVRGSS